MSLQEKLTEASRLQRIVDAGKEAKKELDPLRWEILQEMINIGSTKQKAVGGYYAVYVQTSKRYVEDPAAVMGWIAESEHNMDEFLQLDNGKILDLADTIMREDGEVLPGLGVDTVERVDLKKEKK